MTKKIPDEDYVGKVYNHLKVVSSTDNWSGHERLWEFLCDCGNAVYSKLSHVRDGKTTQCKDCKRAGFKIKLVEVMHCESHGMSYSPEYSSWDCAHQRSTNPNNPEYENYGGRGIDWDSDFDSFSSFIGHVGKMPESGGPYSLGRIDNDLGYVRGNVRWETYSQQAKNRGMRKDNTSGVTGVSVIRDTTGAEAAYFAQAVGLNGEHLSKYFSIRKLGKQEALQLAIKKREEFIEHLNSLGAGYSKKHGNRKA